MSTRVVLVVPNHGDDNPRALTSALEQIGHLGWTLVSVVDPSSAIDALRLVVEGRADVVLATRAEHLPQLCLAADLPSRTERPGSGRTWLWSDGRVGTRQRRPRPIR